MKNNQMTAEEHKTQANLENFVLREGLVDANGWQHYVYHLADTSVLYDIHTITVLEHNWDRDINDFTITITQVQLPGCI